MANASSKGLNADDWVVVSNIQQVRPKMVVRPEKVDAGQTPPRKSKQIRQSQTSAAKEKGK